MNFKGSDQITTFVVKLNEKNPYIIIVVMLAFLLLVDYLVFMQFQIKTLSSLNSNIATKSQEVTAAKNNINRLQQHKDNLSNLSATLEKMSSKVMTREQVPLVLENISKVANEKNVRIEKIIPHPSFDVLSEGDQGQYLSVPVFVEAKSGYHDFGRFLNKLETEESFLNIPGFTISSSKDDSRSLVINLRINAVVFESNQ